MPYTMTKSGLLLGAGLLTILSAGSVSAQYGDGFVPFAQDSCDPLLSGVLTEDGYQSTDLNELYQTAYNADVRRGCGFTKVSDVTTLTPPANNFPDPVALPFPEPTQPVQPFPPLGPVVNPLPLPADPGTNNIVIPEPIDLPDLDLSDDDTGSGVRSGLYARLFGAYVKTKGADGTHMASSPAQTHTFTDSIDAGYGGSATLGYAFNFDGLGLFSNLRSEVQGSYYQFKGDAFTTVPATATPIAIPMTEGSENLYGGFVNLVSDIELGFLPVTPYIGAGLGYGRRDVTYKDATKTYNFNEDGLLYQGMIGGRYSITERLSLDLGYKYLKSFDMTTGVDSNGTYTLGGRNHHIVEGSVTFKF